LEETPPDAEGALAQAEIKRHTQMPKTGNIILDIR
jgi:hypothetical protein